MIRVSVEENQIEACLLYSVTVRDTLTLCFLGVECSPALGVTVCGIPFEVKFKI